MRGWIRWALLAVVCILAGLIILSVLELPPIYTLAWQKVDIPRCGTLKLPQDCTLYEKDGLIYLSDLSGTPLMIETKSQLGFQAKNITESNAFFEDVTFVEMTSSAVFGNGAVHGQILVEQDGEQSQRYYLEIGYDRSVLLVAYHDRIDEKTLIAIAKTFSADDPLPME